MDCVVTATAWEPLVPEAERPGPVTEQLVVSVELQVTVVVFPDCTRVGLAEMVAVGLRTVQFWY